MIHHPYRQGDVVHVDIKVQDADPDQSQSSQPICNHTSHLLDTKGQPSGSWIAKNTKEGIGYSCGGCGSIYGYQLDKKSDAELYQAYLQQQRRLACPGCGEEPFLG